ncbi:ABC transporter permease [Bradyrhizobium genosp. A]|uniref:ABC transporter permease n=1 Tax=Bradyrhizobium genosp. A TaxID=83626 RepID=UPI003CE6F956
MKIWMIRLAIIGGLFALWQLGSGTLFDSYFVSRPSAIAEEFWGLLVSGRLFYHAVITITEALAGFVCGGFIGATTGILLGRNETIGKAFDPIILVFYSLPKIALTPLFVIWFGIDMKMKIILTATIVFFLVFLNTYTGVRGVSRELIAIMKLMGARENHILGKVVLPSVVTWIFAGLKLSVPYALIGAIVGELIAANRGLGYLLSNAAGQFNTAGVFAAIAAIVLLTAALNLAVRLFERWVMPWQAEQQTREISI